MKNQAVLMQLLESWQSERDLGREPDSKELCKDQPELIAELDELITFIRRTAHYFEATPNSATIPEAKPTSNAVSNHETTGVYIAEEPGTSCWDSPSTDPNTAKPTGSNVQSKPPTQKANVQPLPETERKLNVGDLFAGFKLLSVLGEGGFGTVFRAEDIQLHRKVALKILHSGALSQPRAQDNFLTEARALASIHHDNVVPIFQVGKEDGQLFIAMPLLGGETLAARIEREGALPLEEVSRIGREIALGLAALHSKQIVHRDIKPANIWLETNTGRVKILDLGLAYDPMTPLDCMAGTPPYMSPEQALSQPIDSRSDLFSLGTVLYECATGRRPYQGQNLVETIRSVCEHVPVPASKANPSVPKELCSLIEKLQRKNPTQRPSSANLIADALAQGISLKEEIVPEPIRMPAVVPHTSRRFIVVSTIIGFLMVAATVILQTLPNREIPAVPVVSKAANGTLEAPQGPTKVLNLAVRPYELQKNNTHRGMPLLGTENSFRITSNLAIGVHANLSRPAYSYIVVFQGDGKDHVMYPQDENDVPELTDQPVYPSKRRDELWALNDGNGLWLVAVIVSDEPLPSYREWRQQNPNCPWRKHPNQNEIVMRDDSHSGFEVFDVEYPITRGSRGPIQVPSRTPVTNLTAWLRGQSKGTVSALAFSVFNP